MDNIKEECNNVWSLVRYWASRILDRFLVVVGLSQQHLTTAFHVILKIPTAWHPRIVVWEKPPVGSVKLNVSSSCRGNLGPYGGGSIIRANRGNLMAISSKNFGDSRNNGAELQVLINGIQLCKELCFVNICIESELTLVVGWVEKNICFLCYLWDYWETLEGVQ